MKQIRLKWADAVLDGKNQDKTRRKYCIALGLFSVQFEYACEWKHTLENGAEKSKRFHEREQAPV